jgi:hypothetical protein
MSWWWALPRANQLARGRSGAGVTAPQKSAARLGARVCGATPRGGVSRTGFGACPTPKTGGLRRPDPPRAAPAVI